MEDNKISTNPNMYDELVEFSDIKLKVDPITRKRSNDSDNVMAVFWEEQPFTWQFVQPYVKEALEKSSGEIDFLDVGTGSGVFGILMAKHLHASVIALDKSSRAIEQAKNNAALNGVSLDLRHELYTVDSVSAHSVKVIGLYPPYHLYPAEIEQSIPQHARGGSDGQDEFKNQLGTASHHLATDGIIFFNQMCLGNDEGPAFTHYIPELIDGNPSVLYTNVFPPMSTKEFLQGVYGDKHSDYVEKTSQEFPVVYYNVGIIRKDGRGEIKEVQHSIDLKGRTWDDRVKLHYEIAQHEYK